MNSAAPQVRREWLAQNSRVLAHIAFELDRKSSYIRDVFNGTAEPEPAVAEALAKAGAPGFGRVKAVGRAS